MIQEARKALSPRVIRLDAAQAEYLPILEGPPETVSMRSGVVTLAPGNSVGVHSTKGFEELVIVLQGHGEVQIADQDPLEVEAGTAAYCPPETVHNVVNTGTDLLRYVFVVAQAKI